MNLEPAQNQNTSTPFLSVSDAAELLGTSPSTLRNFEKQGRIKSQRLNNGYRMFIKSEVEELKEILLAEKAISKSVQHSNRLIDNSHPDVPIPDNSHSEPAMVFSNHSQSKLPARSSTFFIRSAIAITSLLLLAVGTTRQANLFGEKLSGSLFNGRILAGKSDDLKNLSSISNVLAESSAKKDFAINFNVPAFFKKEVNIADQLTVIGVSNLNGGIITNNAGGNFGTGAITSGSVTTGTTTTGILTFNGVGTMNGLLTIDATTETNLEKLIDINGDVVGTGLTSVKIKSGIIDETYLAPEIIYDGDFDFDGTWAITGTVVDATAEEINYLVGATVVEGGIYFANGTAITQNATKFFWDDTNYRLGVGVTSPTETLDVGGRIHLSQTTAPATTDDRLYNVSGSLYWDGALLNGSGGVLPAATLAGETLYWNGSSWVSSTNIFNNNGNVGIGTTAPENLFNVLVPSGSQDSKGIKVSGSGGGFLSLVNGTSASDVFAPIISAKSSYNLATVPGLLIQGTPYADSATMPGIVLRANDPDDNTATEASPVLAIRNRATDLVLVDYAGKVGIGTTAPTEKLTISNGSARIQTDNGSYPEITLYEDYYGSAWTAGVYSGGTSIDGSFGIDAGEDLTFTPNFIISADGLVGIGTTSPTSLFSVGASSQFQVGTDGSTTIYAPAGSFIMTTDSINISDANEDSVITRAAGSSELLLWAGGNPKISVNPTYINLSGNVGIGTTAPTDKLDVSGGVKIGTTYAGMATTAPTNGLLVQGNVGIGTTAPTSLFSVGASSQFQVDSTGDIISTPGAYWKPSSDSSTALNIGTSNETGMMTFDTSNRRITIGNAASGASLTVNGSASSRYFSISATTAVTTIAYGDNSTNNPLVLENSGPTAAGHGTGLRYNLGYGGTAVYAGRIALNTEGVWSATASTQDSYMGFSTALDGTVAEKMRITSNGYMGIGTTSPEALLSIQQTANDLAGGFKIQSTGSSATYYWVDAGGNTRIDGNDDSTGNIILNSAGSGFVGLGTTSPTDRLDVAGGVKIGTTYAGMATTAPANGLLVEGYVGIGTTAPTRLLQVGTLLYVNHSNDRVGIGIQNPSTTLDVNGIINSASSYALGGSSILGGSSLFAVVGSGYDRGAQARYLTAGPIDQVKIATLFALPGATTEVAAKIWGASGQTANIFEVSPYGGTTKYLMVESDGNVGLGTTNPTSTLSVGASSQFQVNSTGNIVSINNVTTSFPGTQGATGTVLTNSDGAGTLTWGTLGAASVTADSLDWAQFTDTMTLDATTTVNMDTNTADLNFDSGTLYINDAGNVGIGTTAPSGIAGDLTVNRSANTGYIYFGGGTYALAMENGTRFSVNQDLRVSKVGNVTLELYNGTHAANFALAFSNGSYSTAALTGDLVLRTSTGTGLVIGAANDTGTIKFTTGTTETEKMRLSNAGYLGIGTTDPGNLLTISSAPSSLTDFIKLSPNGTTASRGIGVGMIFYGQPTGQNLTYPTGRIYGVWDGDGYGSERLTLQSTSGGGTMTDTLTLKNALVGIGTTTPSTPLHIYANDSVTNSVSNLLRLEHLSTGTVASGFGTGIALYSERLSGGTAYSTIEAYQDGFDGHNLALGVSGTRVITVNTNSGVAGITMTPTRATSTGISIDTNTTTTATAVLMDVDGLTDGNGFHILNNPNGTVLAAGNLMKIEHSGTYISNKTVSGNTLQVTRPITANVNGDSISITGAVLSISDNCTVAAGTCTSSANAAEITQNYASNTGSALNVTTAGSGFALRVNDNGTLTDTSSFVIDSSGNVGIGTTGPGTKLEVVTSTSLDGTVMTDGTRFMRFMAGTVGSSSYNGIVQINDNALIYSAGSSGTGALVIAPWSGSTAGVRMDSSGNVGMGVAAPTDKLDVAGGVKIGATYAGSATTAPSSGLVVEGRVGIGTASPSSSATLQIVPALATTGTKYGIHLSGGTSGTGSPVYNNIASDAYVSSGNGTIYGLNVTGRIENSAASSTAYGVYASSYKNTGSTGTSTKTSAVHARGGNYSTDVVTEANIFEGVFVDNPGTISSFYGLKLGNYANTGTITNTYGVYVGDITSGTQPNTAFSIYSSDASAINYFGGNVGIGTTNPGQKLQVAGDVSLYDGSSTSILRLYGSGGSGNLNLIGDNAASSVMSSSGYILIDADESGAANIILGQNGDGDDVFVYDGTLFVEKDGDNAATYLSASTDGGMYVEDIFEVDGNSFFGDTTSDISSFSGKVGIGTTTPTDKLDIAGASKIGATYAGMATTAPASGLLVEGSVGIGTTAPASKLEVNGGDIRVTGGSFIDDGTSLSVPDYVFETDYDLMSLDSLKYFVEQNKHLPNVPDMNDISGWASLSMQDRDMRLLEKTEENTLYLFQLDAKIAALQNPSSATTNEQDSYLTTDTDLTAGDIVSVDTSGVEQITRAVSGQQILGVALPKTDTTSALQPVSVNGKTLVKVILPPFANTISAGDLVTSSQIAGIGVKSTTAQYVIATALETFDQTTCAADSSACDFYWISVKDNAIVAYQKADESSPDGLTVDPLAADGNTHVLAPSKTISANVNLLWNDAGTTMAMVLGSTTQSTSSTASTTTTTEPSTVASTSISGTELPVLTVTDQFRVLGSTTLGNTSIVGTATVGLTEISSGKINVLGDKLVLQDAYGAGNIEAFGGKIIMTTSGNIHIDSTLDADTVLARSYKVKSGSIADELNRTVGEVTITAGQTSVTVNNATVTGSSFVIITPNTPLASVPAVTSKTAGESFTIELTEPLSTDVTLTWWIVGRD